MCKACDLSAVQPTDLSKLLNWASDDSGGGILDWHERDFASVLRHLLASPLLLVLERQEARLEQEFDGETRVSTLGDALFTPAPDPRLLQLVKHFAKREYQSPQSYLPGPIALLLYYLVICVGLNHEQRRMTELSRDELAKGINWALSQAWIDSQVRDTLNSALRGLNSIQLSEI